MKTLLLAFTLLALPLAAQQSSNYYVASHQASLSSAADTVTVQAPGAPTRGKAVNFAVAIVSCTVVCTITVSQNGTAATTTALPVTALNLSPGGTSVAFSASNVGGGSTIRTYNITDTADHSIDLSSFTLGPGGNLSVGTNSITGTSNISIFYREQAN